MGAWGEGMQANDTALDAIGSAGLSAGEPKKRARTLAKLRSGKIKVIDLLDACTFKEAGWIKEDCQGLLGLAEDLFDEGIEISPIMSLVKKALKNQLSKRQLECWVDGEARKQALLRFKDRLDGKKVSKELLEKDNEGLLSKIARKLG